LRWGAGSFGSVRSKFGLECLGREDAVLACCCLTCEEGT